MVEETQIVENDTYSLEYDEQTAEWVATANDWVRTFETVAQALIWWNEQILEDGE